MDRWVRKQERQGIIIVYKFIVSRYRIIYIHYEKIVSKKSINIIIYETYITQVRYYEYNIPIYSYLNIYIIHL